MLKEYPGDIR